MVYKRPAASKAAEKLPEKKQKKEVLVDEGERRCRDVLLGLRDASAVPSAVIEMLGDVLPMVLLTYRDERHKFQDNVISMAENALLQVEADLQGRATEAKRVVSTAEGAQASEEAQVQEKADAQAAMHRAAQEEKRQLAEDAKAFQTAKNALALAEAARNLADHELKAAEAKRGQLAAVAANCVGPLTEGVEGATAKELVDSMSAIMKEFDFEASILLAVPTVFLKAASTRGAFDMMVITQLEQEIAKRSAALDATLHEAGSTTASHAAAVRAAEEGLAAAQARQQASAEAFLAVQAAHKEVETTLEQARQALHASELQLRKHVKDAYQAEKCLEAFRNGPLSAFLSLRDRSSPQQAPAPANSHEEGKEAAPATAGAAAAEVE